MKTEKHLATLGLCLAVLWGSRFGPYSCPGLVNFPSDPSSGTVGTIVSGALLVGFLFVPAYDLIAFLTYKLGWEQRFDPLDVYPDPPAPGQRPMSQRLKLYVFYPLDLAIVTFFLLPLWIKEAYCG